MGGNNRIGRNMGSFHKVEKVLGGFNDTLGLLLLKKYITSLHLRIYGEDGADVELGDGSSLHR